MMFKILQGDHEERRDVFNQIRFDILSRGEMQELIKSIKSKAITKEIPDHQPRLFDEKGDSNINKK